MPKHEPNKEDGLDTRKDKALRGAKSYIKYSGMAIQMILILLAGYYAGKYLDGYFQTAGPYFMGGLTLLAVGLALYLPLRNL